jgi:hypothetical protein
VQLVSLYQSTTTLVVTGLHKKNDKHLEMEGVLVNTPLICWSNLLHTINCHLETYRHDDDMCYLVQKPTVIVPGHGWNLDRLQQMEAETTCRNTHAGPGMCEEQSL